MKNGAKIITIAQQKGGAGKTTLAAHLAIALMQKRNRVALVDVDPQGSLSHWYKIREDNLGEDYTGIQFVKISGWRVGSELSSLRRNFDYIIIDSPPHIETDAKTVIRESDMTLIPVQPSPTDIWATKATVELANSEKIPCYLVLNRVTHNSKLAENVHKEFKNILKSQLSNRVAFANCLLEGKTVTESLPKSPAAEDVKAIVSEVMGLLHKKSKDKAA